MNELSVLNWKQHHQGRPAFRTWATILILYLHALEPLIKLPVSDYPNSSDSWPLVVHSYKIMRKYRQSWLQTRKQLQEGLPKKQFTVKQLSPYWLSSQCSTPLSFPSSFLHPYVDGITDFSVNVGRLYCIQEKWQRKRQKLIKGNQHKYSHFPSLGCVLYPFKCRHGG